MRAALSPPPRVLADVPVGRPVPLTIARLLGQAHRVAVLRALAASPGPLSYTRIQYEVVHGSGTNLVMSDLAELKLAEKRPGGFVITNLGRKVIAAADQIAALEPVALKLRQE